MITKKEGMGLNYKNGADNRQKCNPGFAVVLGMTAILGLGSCGGSGRLAEFHRKWANNAMMPHEKALVERTKAVADARAAFETARAAGAEWASPYEYYAAEEFLALAKEELDSGDTIGVADFAAESERLSALAVKKTREVPK